MHKSDTCHQIKQRLILLSLSRFFYFSDDEVAFYTIHLTVCSCRVSE